MDSFLVFICCIVWFGTHITADDSFCISRPGSFHPACSQICSVQTEGEVCSCHEGYTLNTEDNKTCRVQGDVPVVFYQNGTTLFVEYTDTQSHFIVKENLGPILKMGFGPNRTLYWIDGDTSTVYSMYMDEDHVGAEVNVVIDSGLMYPNGLAVDWVSSVLYVADTSLGQIVACSAKGENCSVIVRDLVRPLDVNIHTKHRKLIWINEGSDLNTGTVSMAELDGYGPMVLVAGLKSPHNLVLDETIDAIFWISADDQSIHVMHMSNRETRPVIKIPESVRSGFSILGDYIYLWKTTGSRDEVQKVDKFTGQMIDGYTVDDLVIASVFHPVLYTTTQTEGNPCDPTPCSHLCLPQTRHSVTEGFTCRCPIYMAQTSLTECSDPPERSKVIVSGAEGLFVLPVDFIGRSETEVRQLTNQSADVLVYYSITNQLIFYDSERHSIMVTDISDTRLPIKELYTQNLYVEALAINELTNTLYWTTLQGNVHFGPIKDRSIPDLLYSGFRNPRGMAVDAPNGYMFLCDWGKDSQIFRCQLDGSLCETFLEVLDGHPNMLWLENGNRLYWTDSKADSIGSLDLSTNETTEFALSGHSNLHPFCVVTSPDRVFYTDLNTGELHYIVKSLPTVIHTLHLNLGTLYGLAIILREAPTTRYVDTVKPKDAPTYGLKLGRESANIGLVLLAVCLVVGLVLFASLVMWMCYCRRKRLHEGWMVNLVKFVKPNSDDEDDGEHLLSAGYTSCDPTFKHFDEVDYPDPTKERLKYEINNNRGMRV